MMPYQVKLRGYHYHIPYASVASAPLGAKRPCYSPHRWETIGYAERKARAEKENGVDFRIHSIMVWLGLDHW